MPMSSDVNGPRRAPATPTTLAARLEPLRGPLLLLILSPLVVSFRPSRLAWDDVYFLHNSVCLARAFWSASLSGADVCLQGMAKSPLMALLLIPGGPPRGDLEGLGLAPFVLALATGAAILLLARLTALARVPILAAVVAAVAAIAAPALRTHGAPLYVDALFTVLVACLAMMPLVEWEAPTSTSSEVIGRAAVWALLLTAGALTKATFAVFVLALAPAALAASRLRSGGRATLLKLAALAAFSLPLAFLLIRYGASYYTHAKGAAFGASGAFYDDGRSWASVLAEALGGAWPLLALTAALTILTLFRPADRGRLALAGWSGAAMILYLIVATASPNKDPGFAYPRFYWPVWLTLPLCAASAAAAADVEPRGAKLSSALAVALALPMFNHLQLEPLRQSLDALARLPAHRALDVLIATDERDLNIETLLLAQRLRWTDYSQLTLGTLAYDIILHKTPETSLQRIARADYVIARFRLASDAPEWTNRYDPVFEQALEASGRPVETVDADRPLSIFGPKPR